MIQSMTGYGKATWQQDGYTLTIEIKTLNSKQADLSIKLPSPFKELESAVRNELQSQLLRGKIDCSISLESPLQNTLPRFNPDVFACYLDQLNQASVTLGIEQPSDPWLLLLRLPDVFSLPTQEQHTELLTACLNTLKEAINQTIAFREQEGLMLAGVFETKLCQIESMLTAISRYETERIETIRTRILEAFEQYGQKDYDKDRLEQEMIYYIEKLDISEEKSRLGNHCAYFRKTMEEPAGQGKKLGFITQEMGREINTLGSKSNHAQMQQLVVCMKDELEQIKEQVLNVL